jgi:flagellar basal body-associated protein FliL
LKKKIIMAVVALVALLVLGVGGFMGYRAWAKGHPPAPKEAGKPAEGADGAAAEGKGDAAADTKAAAADDTEDEPAAKGGEGGGGAPVMLIHPIIVNLGGNHRNAFLKCDISILFRDAELGRQAASDKPTAQNSIIKAIVLEALSGKTVEEAMDMDTREAVRQEVKDKLNSKFHWSKEAKEAAEKAGKALKTPIKDVLITDWAVQQ